MALSTPSGCRPSPEPSRSPWATSAHGALFTTDATANTVDMVSGALSVGTAYTAVTPCNANSAPATCPAPGFPANYLATLDLTSGTVSPVTVSGSALSPQGLLFAGDHAGQKNQRN